MSPPPDAEAGLLSLELPDARLEIDAARGGRVVALRWAGRNLLTGADVDPINYGSTFWTSPQSQWGWPPVFEIDAAPYDVTRAGEEVVLRGPASETLDVSVEKRFAADRARRAFVLTFSVVNHATSAARVAPWQVTRVQPGGLAFFATGTGVLPHSDLPVVDAEGVTWLHHDAAVIGGHQKLFADTAEGWIAHLDGDTLFVKTFDVVALEAQAPGEAQVELYASSAHRYLEIEAQGACETIAPGASLAWRVEWRVRGVPPGVPLALGSAALVAFARAVAAGQDHVGTGA